MGVISTNQRDCYEEEENYDAFEEIVKWVMEVHLDRIRRRRLVRDVAEAVELGISCFDPGHIEEIHSRIPKALKAAEWKRRHRWWHHFFPQWAGDIVPGCILREVLRRLEDIGKEESKCQ